MNRPSLCRALASAAFWIAVMASACSPAAQAVPDDLRVMTDDLADAGDFDAEIQAIGVKARRSGQLSRQSLAQGLLEISYGVNESLEMSIQLPGSRESGTWHANGLNLEMQYIARHAGDTGLYWGARAELSRSREPLRESRTSSIEVRPIVGYHTQDWQVVLNGAVRLPLSGPDRHPGWEPSAKVARSLGNRTWAGVEYYVQAADRDQPASGGSPRRKLALLVIDAKVRSVDLSFGIGHGVGASGDGAALKLIGSFEL